MGRRRVLPSPTPAPNTSQSRSDPRSHPTPGPAAHSSLVTVSHLMPGSVLGAKLHSTALFVTLLSCYPEQRWSSRPAPFFALVRRPGVSSLTWRRFSQEDRLSFCRRGGSVPGGASMGREAESRALSIGNNYLNYLLSYFFRESADRGFPSMRTSRYTSNRGTYSRIRVHSSGKSTPYQEWVDFPGHVNGGRARQVHTEPPRKNAHTARSRPSDDSVVARGPTLRSVKRAAASGAIRGAFDRGHSTSASGMGDSRQEHRRRVGVVGTGGSFDLCCLLL